MTDTRIKLENWVPFPRRIATDFRNGIITLNEMLVYIWLRLNANPFGISTTSLIGISEDLFESKKTENSINKILLALKRKKYLYYQRRTGSRGSFDVRFGEFILPNKHILSIDKYFETDERRSLGSKQGEIVPGHKQNQDNQEQNLYHLKNDIKSLPFSYSEFSASRAFNIDTDNNTNISNIEIDDKTIISEFKPKNLDEHLCLNIAIYLREKHINYILSIYKRLGRIGLEKALRIFKDHETKTQIGNRGAYFNALINRMNNNPNI